MTELKRLIDKSTYLQITAWITKSGWALRIGVMVLLAYIVLAVVGPWLLGRDPYQQELRLVAAPPSLDAPFGYDELGRDLLARILAGARITLGISGAAVAVGGATGVIIGILAGYYRGWTDTVLMRAIDTLLAFPSLILALAIVAALGSGPVNLTIAAAIYCIPQYARVSRATILSLISQEYVTAASVAGASPIRIMRRHLLPNALAPLIVQTSYAMAAVILVTSGLSFLGLGVQPPSPEWGAMLARGRDFLRTAPHIVVIPGTVIALLILALNLAGDGLRDLLDPRLRRQ